MLVGLVVNPIAGMGGRVGLKGTDGVVDEALKLGAEPVAPGRAKEFLESLLPLIDSDVRKIELVTCPDAMGGDYSREIGINHRIVDVQIGERTTAVDTKACILALHKAGVRLIVFVGGDGTARDIFDAVEENGLNDLMVLGVPSGVKMYSGIFVINPRDAADVIRLLSEGTATMAEFEVMDADEE
ncbi:MAG: NAD(+)/NADH kinase, partial [Candidatus Thorarchaeota archaeon]